MHLLDILQDLDNPDLFPYGFPEPEDEMYGKHEKEIAVLTDERLKKLYALWKNSERGERNALKHVADAFARGEDARLHMDAATLYKNRKQVLYQLLHVCLIEHYNLIASVHVRISRGWKVSITLPSF